MEMESVSNQHLNKTTSVNVRLIPQDKEEFEAICDGLGLNVTTALQMYVKAVLRSRGISFLPLQQETPTVSKIADDVIAENLEGLQRLAK